VDPALPAANRVVYGDTWRWTAGSWTKVQDIGPTPRWGHGFAHRTNGGRIVAFGGASGFAVPQSGDLALTLLGDTWERPFNATGSPGGGQPQPGGGQPQPGGGQPQPGTVDVATITVQPDTIPNQPGMVMGVGVILTAPPPTDISLQVVIAAEQAGSWNMLQTPGFDLPTPPSPMVTAGSTGTQFQITRNTDPLDPGNYAVAVAVPGGQFQGGYFTIS
jgi:hypothetical protein